MSHFTTHAPLDQRVKLIQSRSFLYFLNTTSCPASNLLVETVMLTPVL
jgi:hypothetical protein